MKGKIYIAHSTNPAYNLAFEETLLDKGEEILYLWQNDNTVVIGQNQNPYKECRLSLMRENNVTLVRRKSGGGAVYHDLGNLNFTLIRDKKVEVEENYKMVKNALKTLGINAKLDGRNDISVDGKKFSGNSYYQRGDFLCHHGTLMIDVDVSKVNEYLKPSKLKLETKSIDSIRKRVVNLKEVNPKITVERVEEALISEFKKLYPNSEIIEITLEDLEKSKVVTELAKDYSSWESTYSKSPQYDVSLEEKFSWGLININLSVRQGFIKEVSIDTDSIVLENFKELESGFYGKKFRSDVLKSIIEDKIKDKEIKSDLKRLIEKIDNA